MRHDTAARRRVSRTTAHHAGGSNRHRWTAPAGPRTWPSSTIPSAVTSSRIDPGRALRWLTHEQQTAGPEQLCREPHHLEHGPEGAGGDHVESAGGAADDLLDVGCDHLDTIGGIEATHTESQQVSALVATLHQGHAEIGTTSDDHQAGQSTAGTQVDEVAADEVRGECGDVLVGMGDRLVDGHPTDRSPSLDLCQHMTQDREDVVDRVRSRHDPTRRSMR